MQEEIIDFRLEGTEKAVKDAGRINAGLHSVETTVDRAGKAATSMAQQQMAVIGSLTSRTGNSIERIAASAERRVMATKPLLERLRAEMERDLGRVRGDSQATARVSTAFGQLIEKEKQLIASQQKVEMSASSLGNIFRNPLQAAGNAVDSFVGKFGKIGVVAAGVTLGLGSVAKAAFDLVSAQSDAAEQTVNLADRLGITAGEARVLEGATKIAGVSIDSLVGLERKLAGVLSESNAESRHSISVLDQMGVRVVNTSGHFRSSIDILRDFSGNLSKIPDHARQVALVTQLFGRGAIELLPLIKNFRDLEEQSRATGAGMDGHLIQRLAKVNDRLDDIGLRWERLKLTMTEGIIAPIDIIERYVDRAGAVTDRQRERFGDAASRRSLALREAGEARGGAAVHSDSVFRGDAEGLRKLLGGFGRGQQTSDIAAGDALLMQFKARVDDDRLREDLQGVQKSLSGARAKAQFGLPLAVQKENIAEIDRLGSQAKILEAQIKALEEAPRKLEEANKAAAAELERAIEAQLTPMEKIFKKFEALVDNAKKVGAPENTLEILRKAQDLEVSTERRKVITSATDPFQKSNRGLAEELEKARVEQEMKSFEHAMAQRREARGVQGENLQTQLTLQQSALEARMDSELRSVSAIAAFTIDQKLFVEQERAKIESTFAQESLELKRRMLGVESSIEIAKAGENAALVLAIKEKYLLLEQQAKLNSDSAIDAARENAAINSTKIIVDENQRRLDTLQRQAEGVFDQMIRVWKDGWSGAANFMQTLLLTAIKNIVTSSVARSLNGMMGGGMAGTGRAAGGGLLASLFGGGFPAFGAADIGPGGTSGFAGPVGLAPQLGGFGLPGSSGSAAAGGGFMGGLKGIGSNFMGSLTQLGNIGAGTGMKAHGIAGAKGGALLGGGAMLAMDGIRRGGWVGLGETTAGGAMIGAKFGGPMGALIGGAIGFGIGLIGVFRKRAEEKIVEKVKSLYGITIDKSFAKDPLLGIIKQNFGGNVDVGIRSPQVRELLELYAMSTGERSSGIVQRVQASTFANIGGVLQQMPTYQNGAQVFGGGGAGSGGSATGSGAFQTQTMMVMMKLDGPATTALLRAEAVQAIDSSPRNVAAASAAGQKEGVARRSTAALGLQPGFRTS